MATFWYDLGARAKCQDFGICQWNGYGRNTDYSDLELFGNSTPTPTAVPTGQPVADDKYIGFICCAIAVVFFGINWTPAKKFYTGDGVFFQFILCNAALALGVAVHAWRSFPPVYPLAMLSGVLWCTGNMVCVPIIQLIGMGLGLLIWNSANLIIGWASGKWGWFGITPQPPTDVAMNYGGVVLALLSAVLFVLVKPNIEHDPMVHVEDDLGFQSIPPRTLSDADATAVNVRYEPINADQRPTEMFATWTPLRKRIVGVAFSMFAGTMFGLMFTPIIYLQDHPEIFPGASKNVLDHVFAFTLGIYCTSLFYTLLYSVIKRNKPFVSGDLVLPAFACGLMWVVGQTSFLVAVQYLSEPVSFPIIASGPGIIGALVGVVFFKEIRGWKNYLVLVAAFVCVVSGAILSGLSKS